MVVVVGAAAAAAVVVVVVVRVVLVVAGRHGLGNGPGGAVEVVLAAMRFVVPWVLVVERSRSEG